MKKEIEIKIKIDKMTFDKFVFDKLNFQFEKTYGYFTDNYENIKKGIFPRIKVIDKISLVSIKVRRGTSKMFERDEYEFEVETNKTETVREMFKLLGYTIEHVFEKKRYVMKSLNNCDFVIDELPFGYFIEIEGKEEEIERTIKELNLDNNERINGAYLKLWEEHKQKNNIEGECIFI